MSSSKFYQRLFSSILLTLVTFINCTNSLAEGNTWSSAGTMSTPRTGHTATKLKGGEVLVAGGENSNGSLNSAEIFNPSTGEWTTTGSMNKSRSYHAAILLDDNTVLVTGGLYPDSAYVELYDPSTKVWSATGSTISRHGDNFIAVKLADGKVLVASGRLDNGSTTLAEIYDPITKTWTQTGSMKESRSDSGQPTATLLQNGKVLVTGGYCTYDLDTAELFDPDTGEWTSTGSMNVARSRGHRAILTPDGKVLVTGGSSGGMPTNSAELYDPDTETWSEIGSMKSGLENHSINIIDDNQILVAGGTNITSVIDPVETAEIYNPSSQWTLTGSMATARYDHTYTKIDTGQILVAGGRGADDPIASAEVYGDGEPPASITISDGAQTISVQEKTPAFTAIGKDSDGNVMPNLIFIWTTGGSDDTGTATIDDNGIATGIEPGTVTITATSCGVSNTVKLIVLGDLETITITDGASKVACEHDTPAFTAIGKDSNGNVIPDIDVAWSSGDSGDTGTVTIGAETGIATGVTTGSATILAISGDIEGRATIEVTHPTTYWIYRTMIAAGSLVTIGTGFFTARNWYKNRKNPIKETKEVIEALLTSGLSRSSSSDRETP